MDEPLASLDSDRKSEVLPFVAKLPAEFNIPILYVSHSMAEMRSIAGRVIFIEAGRVLKEEGSITWSSGFSVSEF